MKTAHKEVSCNLSPREFGRGVVGAGRPASFNRTRSQMKAVERAFQKMARLAGISLGQLLAEIAYNCNWTLKITATGSKFQPEVPYNTRLRAIELYLNTVIRSVEHHNEKHPIGPVIMREMTAD